MPHRPHRPLLRPLMGLAVGLLVGPAAAQHAFNDSIAAAAARMAAHLHAAGRARVAVTDVTAPGGAVPAATASYVEEVLVMRLSGAPGITVVERRQLDRVLEEQRRTAAGTFDDDQAIELGRLLAADAIITGRLFPVDKKLHVMLRALDTGTGTLVGTAETITTFPKGKGPEKAAREREKADPVRMRRERTPSERTSIIELRAMGMGARQWERLAGGATLELALRSHEKNGDRIVPGKMAIGLQLTVLPRMAAWAEAPFEVGHIAGIQATDGYAGTPTVRFGGVSMAQGRLFLQPLGGAPLSFDSVTAPGGSGIVQVAHERYRLRNVRMDQVGFHIPLRIYLAQGYMYDNVPKLYMDLGFGMDLALVRADHEITSTWVRLGADDLAYTVQEETFTMGKPGMGGMGAHIWTTHASLGGGLEAGRFNLFVLGRYLLSSTFSAHGREYQRLRGNIVAYPLLAGAADNAATRSEVEHAGALPYGAMGLERARNGEAQDGGATVTGNGVDRFWRNSQLIFGIGFRFL